MSAEGYELNLAIHDGSVYLKARPEAFENDLCAIEQAMDVLGSVTKLRAVVVDMAEIDELDHEWLRRVLHLQSALTERDATVALVHVQASVKRILDHAGITPFLLVTGPERPSTIN